MALSSADRSRRYDEANRERRKEAARLRRLADPEGQREIKRRSYEKHREKHLAYAAAYRAAHPEQYKEYDRLRDPEENRARCRKWKARNPEKCREHGRKRLSSPAGVVCNIVRARIREWLRTGRPGRRTAELLGYTIAELRIHLERQFLPGMGWHNMGKWHIDHIVPLASFTITGPDDPELKRAWALPNLRPLWARDNIAKGAKVQSLL